MQQFHLLLLDCVVGVGGPTNKNSKKRAPRADDGPWRQSDVLKEPWVQLQVGPLIAPKKNTDLGADDAVAE